MFFSELLVSIKKPEFKLLFQELLAEGDTSVPYAAAF
jgi:hypothetical protein